MKNDKLITIFIPVYNGEKYLQQTLTSIKKQTYTNIEIILVDDSSCDSSLQIISQYAKDDKRFKIFVKENGAMVANSMNFVMPKINGDYFFYASQDDIFSLDLVQQMVEKQNETGAECVLPIMEFYFEKKLNNKRIVGLNGDKNIQLSGKEACTASLNWSIHGFALIKSDLVKAEFFPEDAFDSDEYITRKLFLKSNKVVFSDGVFFYRQDNLNAITKTFGKKNFYVLNSSWKLYTLLKENNFDENIIFNTQIGIIHQYLDLYSIFESFTFINEIDKNDVQLFLKSYKNEQLINNFLFYNLQYAFRHFKWKYLILIMVIKVGFLFKIFVENKRMKLKKSNFKRFIS